MRHSVLEAWFEKRGITYRYVESVALSHIAIDQGAVENIRLNAPLNEERILTYAIEVEADAKFPAIVLWPAPKQPGHYLVVNGLHRCKAYELAKKKTTDAYVIESQDPVLLEVLRRTINIIEGEALSIEQRIEHALRLIELSHTAADAARLTAVPISRLQQAIALTRIRPRLEKHGLRVGDLALTPSQLVVLNAIPRDKHCAAAVKLAHEARMNSDEVKALVREVRAAADDDVAEKVLTTWAERYADTVARAQRGTIRPPGSPIRRLAAIFSQAERLLGDGSTARGARTLGAKEINAMIAQAQRMIAHLQDFIAGLKRARKTA